MKKLSFLFLALLATLGLWASDFTVDSIAYNKLGGDSVEVSSKKSGRYSGDIVIPSTVTYEKLTYHVVAIGSWAFSFSPLNSISIPQSVSDIKDHAFVSSSIRSNIISLPEGVKTIGESAFSNISTLQFVTLPSTLISIGNEAFQSNSNISSFTIYAKVPPTCGSSCFEKMRDAIPIYVPVESINAYKTADGWKMFSNILSVEESDSIYGQCGDSLTWKLKDSVLIIKGTGAMYDYSNTSFPWQPYLQQITEVYDYRLHIEGWAKAPNIEQYHIACMADTSGWNPNTIRDIFVPFEPDLSFIRYDRNLGYIELLKTPTSCGEAVVVGVYPYDSTRYVAKSRNRFWNSQTKVLSIGQEEYNRFQYYHDTLGVYFEPINQYHITTTCDKKYGYITQSGKYWYGDTVKLTVVPQSDFVFKCWSDGNTDNPRYITVRGNATYAAEFLARCGDNLYWEIKDSILFVTGYGDMWDLNVNQYYGSYHPMWNEDKNMIAFIQFPDSITSIGNEAFYNCSNLLSVKLPNSIKQIGDYAFAWCPQLSSINLPESVDSLGNYVFCWSKIDKPLYNSRIFAFLPTSIKGDYKIPDGIEKLANGFMCGQYINNKLSSLTIPASVTTPIEYHDSCFTTDIYDYRPNIGCDYISICDEYTYYIMTPQEVRRDCGWKQPMNIVVPSDCPRNSVCGQCGDNAYWSLDTLACTIVISGKGAIYNYTYNNVPWREYERYIRSVSIQDGITKIGDEAFYGFDSIYSVSLPNSLTSIGIRAFQICRHLSSINIPSSVDYIGDWAFEWCTSLPIYKNLRYADTYMVGVYDEIADTSFVVKDGTKWIGSSAFYYHSSITSISLPDGIIEIGDSAFTLSKLSSISLPSSVKRIRSQAFSYCFALGNITSYASTPPVCDPYTFAAVDKSIPVYVPAESVNAYKAADVWKDFTNIVPIGENLENGHEYVDLGLSVKWATMNLGSTKVEEYGDYFAWGETSPKTDYTWSTYKYSNGNYNSLTKYCVSSSFGKVDDKTTLEIEDDAAHVNWGGNWHIPTHAEQEELYNNCTITWTSNYMGTGVAGRIFTSQKTGYTDKSIFLPAAGYRIGTGLDHAGSYGEYWSSSLDEDYSGRSQNMYFHAEYVDTYYGSRNVGQSIRAVCQPSSIFDPDHPLNPGKYEIKLQANPVEGGQMFGAGSYAQDSTITISAHANVGYYFTQWSDGVTDSIRNIRVGTHDTTFVAYFSRLCESRVVVKSTKKASELNLCDQTDLYIQETGLLRVDQPTEVRELTMYVNNSQAAQISGINNLTIGNLSWIIQLEPNHSVATPAKWYAFAVPFEVNLTTDIRKEGATTPASYGTDFLVEYYDGALRATTQQGWVRCQATDVLQPGKFYMMAVNGTQNRWEISKRVDGTMSELYTIQAEANDSQSVNHRGWNGLGNTLWQSAVVSIEDDSIPFATIYNNAQNVYEIVPFGRTVFATGSPFFVQVNRTTNVLLAENTQQGVVARKSAMVENPYYEFAFASAVDADYVATSFVAASASKVNEYIIGRDVEKTLSKEPIVPQMWINAYGTTLAAHEAALMNKSAYISLGLYVPKAGEYRLSHVDNAQAYDLELRCNGQTVGVENPDSWKINLEKGTNNDYALIITSRTISTAVNQLPDSPSDRFTKIIRDGQLLILRDGKTYNAQGTEL